ncbi:MAG: HD domain-containing protein [Spirochaetales bacterium]
MKALQELEESARWYYASFSALDRYFGIDNPHLSFVAVEGDLVTLAKNVAQLDFPGVYNADAATWSEGRRIYFRCVEPGGKPAVQSYSILNLHYDPAGKRYLDPYDDYRALRAKRLLPTAEAYSPLHRLFDGAIAIARYPHELATAPAAVPLFPELPDETLRMVLTSVLTGRSADRGTEFLRRHGFVEAYLPELVPMVGTGHSKEHHPEGDVWTHSLETFRYRRSADLTLTLALLFHDSGKPSAVPKEGRRFHNHAEIGAKLASRVLRRLGFEQPLIDDVYWLVQKHMFPGAIHKLPTFRTERLMSHRLFPLLLELYRCDLESTYRGPEGYYRACKVYRDFLKHQANPFRDAEGKKLVRLYVD